MSWVTHTMMYGICYIRAQKHRQFTHQKLKAKREIYLVLRELCPYEQRGHKSSKNNPKFVNDECYEILSRVIHCICNWSWLTLKSVFEAHPVALNEHAPFLTESAKNNGAIACLLVRWFLSAGQKINSSQLWGVRNTIPMSVIVIHITQRPYNIWNKGRLPSIVFQHHRKCQRFCTTMYVYIFLMKIF